MRRNPAAFLPALLLLQQAPLYGHIADEIAVKTGIVFNGDSVEFSFAISSGVIFSTAFLKILDPDRNKIFEEDHVRDFSDWFLQSLKVGFNGVPESPAFTGFSSSDWDFFAAGVADTALAYRLPLDPSFRGPGGEPLRLDYDLSFFPNVAIYSLSVRNSVPRQLEILTDRRNEFLQDRAEISFAPAPEETPAEAAESAAGGAPPPPAPGFLGGLVRGGFEGAGILGVCRALAHSMKENVLKARFLPYKLPKEPVNRDSCVDFGAKIYKSDRLLALIRGDGGTIPALFLLLAVAVGFLHAFSPGHGKALVGAFLIANRGTAAHALSLGLVITAAHTLSIYAFGLLASAAARFFLPGDLIPLLGAGSGMGILALGLWSLVKRIRGRAESHAHLVPNLRILKKTSVNILVDGRAAEAVEALLIALEDEDCRGYLRAAGAEDFNLCSPGCAVHAGIPRFIQEQRRSQFFKTALRTGAVEAVLSFSGETARALGRVRERTLIRKGDAVLAGPKDFLRGAAENYALRGEITLPREGLSWGRIIGFGVTGGIVPCPDALAVLLLSIAAGKILLGLWIIFFFSLGLAAALVLAGMLVVYGGRLLRRGSRRVPLEKYLPALSSLFIMVLGILMVKTSLVF